MKIFLPVFLAILAAAFVIFGIKFCSDSFSDLAAQRRQTERLKEQADALKRQAEFYNGLVKDMQEGPNTAYGKLLREADCDVIRVHNETLSVAAMRVSNPDGLPFRIHW